MKDLCGHLNDWYTCIQLSTEDLHFFLIRYILVHPHSDMYLHHNFACREELDRTVTQERSERMETWEHQVHVATLVQQESMYVPVTINSI